MLQSIDRESIYINFKSSRFKGNNSIIFFNELFFLIIPAGAENFSVRLVTKNFDVCSFVEMGQVEKFTTLSPSYFCNFYANLNLVPFLSLSSLLILPQFYLFSSLTNYFWWEKEKIRWLNFFFFLFNLESRLYLTRISTQFIL